LRRLKKMEERTI